MSKFAALLLGLLVLAAIAPLFTADPAAQDRDLPFHSPVSEHLLGTDGLGRDVFARLVSGTRLSLTAAALATAAALLCALTAGGTAGLFPGLADTALMGLAELFQSLPWICFVLGIRALLPLSLTPARALLAIGLVAGLTGWPRAARIIRGLVLELRTRDYVAAARSFGAGKFYLLRRHILPGTLSAASVQAVLLLPQFLLLEVTLSFLGVGIGEPTPSLGGMLSDLRDLHVLTSYPWMLAPVLMVLVLVSLLEAAASRVSSHNRDIK
jgi:peptide/nickel transport system permease protein